MPRGLRKAVAFHIVQHRRSGEDIEQAVAVITTVHTAERHMSVMWRD